jgi:hypothetical protein
VHPILSFIIIINYKLFIIHFYSFRAVRAKRGAAGAHCAHPVGVLP